MQANRPEINVTPLVDVVLVLLIIFMVVAPRLEKGAAVDLPALEHVDKKASGKHEPLTVSVTKKGTVYIEDDLVSDKTRLPQTLRTLREQTPDRRVVLKADKETRYGDVRNIFKQCQQAGFTGIAMQVGEKRDTGAGVVGGGAPQHASASSRGN